MADKLALELHVPGISLLQLQELSWKTKEKLFLFLLDKNATSLAVFQELSAMAMDRKQERAVEKMELSKDVARKKEESYRANFMKIVAKELARMGAPALITWQRLVLDRDCTYQAARILLTKMKSSQKKRPVSTYLPLLESKPPSQAPALEERPEWISEIPVETNQKLPSPKLVPKKPSPVRPTNQVEELAPGMTVTRTQTVPKQPKKPDRKLQAALLEIEALKSEINHLEAINAALTKQDDVATQGIGAIVIAMLIAVYDFSKPKIFNNNIDMLMDAIAAREAASNGLYDILSALQQVVQTGLNEAKEAGAEQGKKTQWMMAVPSETLQALNKLEKQLAGANRSLGSCMEQKLRYSNEQLLDENYKEIKLQDIHTGHSCHGPHHIPSLRHLRPNQVVHIENSLSKLTTDLMEFSKLVTQTTTPSLCDSTSMELHRQACELAKETRSLAAHTASFGALVCSQAVGPGFERNNPSTPSIKAILSELPPISSAHKDREKHFRMLLERLGRYLCGLEAQLESCSTELKVLHKCINTQASAIQTLVHNVQSIGSKKLEWVQETLTASIDSIVQVFDAFKLQQCQGGVNPYGDLLVSTYDLHREHLTSLKHNYKQYAQATHAKLSSLVNECIAQCPPQLHTTEEEIK